MIPKNFDLNALKSSDDLKNKLIFTFFALIIYRFGSFVPLPSINPLVLAEYAKANVNGILGMFNMLSGGSLERMTIFALAIMPYITSSIIMQLLTSVFKNLETLKKEGERGRSYGG